MEIQGIVIQVLAEQSGEGKNGTWRKQEFVIETEAQYPKKVCFTVWGDRIDLEKMQVGKRLNVSFDVESREYNGRWFTDVKAWRLDWATEGDAAATPSATSAPKAAPAAPVELSPNLQGGGDDDLPF